MSVPVDPQRTQKAFEESALLLGTLAGMVGFAGVMLVILALGGIYTA